MERKRKIEKVTNLSVCEKREREYGKTSPSQKGKKIMYALKLDTILGDDLNTVKENNPEMEYEIEFKLLILIPIFLI